MATTFAAPPWELMAVWHVWWAPVQAVSPATLVQHWSLLIDIYSLGQTGGDGNHTLGKQRAITLGFGNRRREKQKKSKAAAENRDDKFKGRGHVEQIQTRRRWTVRVGARLLTRSLNRKKSSVVLLTLPSLPPIPERMHTIAVLSLTILKPM